MPKITQSFLSRVRPTDRDVFYWDDGLAGFGVRVKPSGAVSFLIQYRNAGGRSRRYTIGRYGKVTVEKARTAAKRLFGAIADGDDPAADKSEKRGAATVAELCERFLSDYATVHKKASSVREDRRILERTVRPALGKMKVADVTRADIAKLHHRKRETPYEANRTLALLSKLFNLAELWGLRTDGTNPCRHVRRYREAKRERFFSADELKRIGAALAAAERDGSEKPGTVNAIRLLALTGCRLGEILSLEWGHVDFDGARLRLSDTKTGGRDVPLPAPALALLSELERDGRFVVYGRDPAEPLSVNVIEKAWRRIRERADVADARLHDFRHTVGTYGGQAGFNAFLVRDLLGHKTLAMTGRYVERDHDPVRQAADQVAGRIAAAMDGKQDADVVPLKRGA
jgi:integrase